MVYLRPRPASHAPRYNRWNILVRNWAADLMTVGASRRRFDSIRLKEKVGPELKTNQGPQRASFLLSLSSAAKVLMQELCDRFRFEKSVPPNPLR